MIDQSMLDPELRKRWNLFCQVWRKLHGDNPFPFVVSVYRDAEEQEKKVLEGKSDARAGHSLHNYKPTLALDYAFKVADSRTLLYSDALFDKAFQILPKLGLACGVWIHGGATSMWHDKGHTQPLGYTWQQAKAGIQPAWSTLKGDLL